MAGLVRVDVEAVLRHIGTVCAREPRVAAAYLFGSALGEMRPDSDIDVAVVLSKAGQAATGWSAFALPVQLGDALGRWDGHPFEVTVLSLEDPVFAMSALRDAVLAYEGDGEAHADFLEAVAQRYRLDGHRYWQAVREVNRWDAPDPERIGRRAASVGDQAERLQTLAAQTDEATFTAPGSWLPAAVRYSLQTAIEGLIDIAYHVCARRFSYAAPDARSAFRRLAEAGLLTPAHWNKVDGMVGFRNVLIHGYDTVSTAQVYRVLREEVGDIASVLAALEAAAEGAPTVGEPAPKPGAGSEDGSRQR